MTPREWNHVLDHKVEWSIAYPAVAREVQALLATTPYPGPTTTELVEALYPMAVARGDGIFARARIYKALDALREHELADWCHQEEPTRARFGKMIRRVRWHQPQAVTEAEEVQTPAPSPAGGMDAKVAAGKCLDLIDASSLPEDHPEYGKDHLRTMVAAICHWDLSDPKVKLKAMRWLGWLQCAVVMGGGATLEQMKAINKAV